jgi:hypothetical protein
MSTNAPGSWRLHVLLFVVAATVRIAYVVHDQSYRAKIGGEMERAAASVARDGSIANVYADGSGPSAHVAPLYPLFLGTIYRLFGLNTLAGRLVEEGCAIAVTLLGLALLPAVARRAGLSPGAGWAAAFLLAVLPVNLWVETSGSWEQPYAAVALLGLFLTFCRLHDEAWQRQTTIVAAGLLLGVTALLTPALLSAGGLMLLAEWCLQRGARRRVLRGGVVLSLVATAMLTPWVVRNYVVLGGFIPLRSNLGLELSIGNNPQANGKTFATSYDDLASPTREQHPFTSPAQRAHLAEVGERAYMQEKQTAALHWMAYHPRQTLELTARRVRLYWVPPVEMWPGAGADNYFKAMVFALLGLAALTALAGRLLGRCERAGLLAAAVLGPSLIHLVTHVDPRYRYPVFGLTAVLAAHLVIALGRVVFGMETRGAPESVAGVRSAVV